jgi:class 3 adenylate cyclase
MERPHATAPFAGGHTASSPHAAGLVTLLFSDIAGSTALKQQLGDHAAFELVQQHHQLVRTTLAPVAYAREISVAGDSFLIPELLT